MKVLIVDDEVIIRTGLSTVIPWAEHGFEVMEPAASAEEALERIPEEQPEIVMTDIRMTGRSGLELAHEVKLKFPDTELIIITGFDDFSYVQQALREGVGDYLLKTSRPGEIVQAADQARSRVLEQRRLKELRAMQQRLVNQGFLRNLLASGTGADEEIAEREFRERYPDLRLTESGERLEVWRITANNQKDPDAECAKGGERLQQASGALTEQIGAMLAGRLQGEWLPWGEGLLLVVRRERDCGDGWCAVETAIRSAEQSLGCPILAACGEPTVSARGLRSAVETAEETAQFHWLLHPKRTLRYDEIRRRKGCRAVCSQEEEHALSLLLRAGNPEELRAWICGQLQRLRLDEQATPGSVRAYLHSLAVAGRRWLERAASSIGHAYTFSGSEEELDLDELARAPEEALFAHLESLMNQHQVMVGGISPVQSAISYIHDHLGQSLSLNQVAGHVHMNPNYFSAMFKRETGQNYIEFVTRAKLQRAMAMLRETTAKISEIANGIGYEDLKYFNRLFKKFTGLTPSEYRERPEKCPSID
ncbi:response regulator [Paenibacillus vini]|uniref:DNA-binding response regulator n=1 Tax=Paenibacillus vini TaxID=1476024 RepID=A0ABQ4M9H6_9BACL|nr:helix-turn-helix domain-containing protein [Paenibacillus vini]GIP52653.1 hypothetical protein J42TS3_16880 [Paenibacillus vini]